jgi:hypothetical protein
MSAVGFVPTLDEIEDRQPGLVAGLEAMSVPDRGANPRPSRVLSL